MEGPRPRAAEPELLRDCILGYHADCDEDLQAMLSIPFFDMALSCLFHYEKVSHGPTPAIFLMKTSVWGHHPAFLYERIKLGVSIPLLPLLVFGSESG